MTCMVIFTVSSLFCGIAPSLGFLLFFRVLQGAGGGGLQPMAQAILADAALPPGAAAGLRLPNRKITAVCAPAIGPTLGGWLTDNASWRWIFLINLPVGLLALALVYRLVQDPPYLIRRKRAEIRVGPSWDFHCWRSESVLCKLCWTRGKKTTGLARRSSQRWLLPRVYA